MKHIIVVGAGIRGIVGAILLRKAGHEVTVIEAAPLPGGILVAEEWEGLFVDKGCHLLDFAHDASAKIYQDILGDALHPIDRRYASINRGVTSGDIAVPDMSRFPKQEQSAALESLQKRRNNPTGDPDSLKALLQDRYGEIAGEYAAECARTMTNVEPNDLAPEAFAYMPLLRRIRLGADEEMRQLKESPELDERLAISSAANPMHFYKNNAGAQHRSYYPSVKGMRGFCEAAANYLANLGVNMKFSQNIKAIQPTGNGVTVQTKSGKSVRADACYWSIPPSIFLNIIGEPNPLADFVIPWSMLLYTFKTPLGTVLDNTYVHDYSSQRLCFRGSAPGKYGRQTDAQNQTYVCAEVPAQTGSATWASADELTERIWAELQDMEIVARDSPYSTHRIDRFPVILMLPKRGWAPAKQAHDQRLKSFGNHIQFIGGGVLGKSATVDSVTDDLQAFL